MTIPAAQRVPAVKRKKPEDFVNTRFLKELEAEGFKEITRRLIQRTTIEYGPKIGFSEHNSAWSLRGQDPLPYRCR